MKLLCRDRAERQELPVHRLQSRGSRQVSPFGFEHPQFVLFRCARPIGSRQLVLECLNLVFDPEHRKGGCRNEDEPEQRAEPDHAPCPRCRPPEWRSPLRGHGGAAVRSAARRRAARARGLRAISDFEFEFQMALMNRKLDEEIETIFLMPKEEYTYLSSRIVKEITRLGGNVSAFVPRPVAEALAKKMKR